MASVAQKTFQNMQRCLKFMSEAKGLNSCMKHCKLLEGEPGRVLVSYKVPEEHTNVYGTLHGGMSATLVDIVTSMAVIGEDEDSILKMGVSTNINMSYLRAGKVDEEILIEATAKKIGRKLAFFECELRSKETNKVLVTGSHTKFM